MGILQTNWRCCERCLIMFYDGFPDNKGSCMGGGGHQGGRSHYFYLAHDDPITSPYREVPDWRSCGKCLALYWDVSLRGRDRGGRCCTGGAHEMGPGSFNYICFHDVSLYPQKFQKDWRLCTKCIAMFYDGYNLKGLCPGRDGGHYAEPSSSNYAFIHSVDLQDDPE